MRRVTQGGDINFNVADVKGLGANYAFRFYTTDSCKYIVKVDGDAVEGIIRLEWEELKTLGDGVLNYCCENLEPDEEYSDATFNRTFGGTTQWYIVTSCSGGGGGSSEEISELSDRLDAEIDRSSGEDIKHDRLISANTQEIQRLGDRLYTETYTKAEVDQKIAEAEMGGDLPENIVIDANYVHTDNNYTTTDKNKLNGIAAGAEVNVQADWNETDTSSDAYIQHKPTIPSTTSQLTNDSNFVVDANYVHTDNNYTTADKNKVGNLKPVATSGNYNDLSNKPTIPTVPENIVQSVTINGNTVTPNQQTGNVDLGTITGIKGDKGDKGDTVVLDPSQVEQFEIINGLNATTAGDGLDATQGTRLKNAILTLLDRMANTAFIGTRPTAEDLGLATASFLVTLNIGNGANASNNSTVAYQDATYTNTITAETGYALTSVSVIHNEQTVQTEIINNECVISIPHVAGAISISVVAQQVAVVGAKLIGCTSSNAATGAALGSSYNATITPTQGNTLTNGIVHVIMNEVDVTETAYSNGSISINSVTGDIDITVIAVDTTYGYVAGSVMHLDGIDKGSNSNAWTDLVGGLVFTNHGATNNSNCWTMSGGQWLGGDTLNGNAIFDRDISTIEAVFTGDSSRGANICNFGNPATDHGISLEIGYHIYGVPTADGKAWDSQAAGTYGNTSIHVLSVNKDIYVDNGVKKTNKKNGYSDLGSNSGYWIGRDTSSDWSRHRGNIYAIRIYERLLTEEEIAINQYVDYIRFVNPS